MERHFIYSVGSFDHQLPMSFSVAGRDSVTDHIVFTCALVYEGKQHKTTHYIWTCKMRISNQRPKIGYATLGSMVLLACPLCVWA